MLRWSPCGHEQRDPDRNKEAHKHRLGLVLLLQKPAGMPQGHKERINDRQIQKPKDHKDDPCTALFFHFDLGMSELVASAAAATQRIHKLAHTQAKDKICITLLIHRVEVLK